MQPFINSLSILVFLFVIGCGESETTNQEDVTQPKMTVEEMETPSTLIVGITGMMCPNGCAKVVQKEIFAIEGIATSTVDFGSKTGTFQYDAAIISQDEIIAAIEKVNKGAYKTESAVGSERGEVPNPDAEAVEEMVNEEETSV